MKRFQTRAKIIGTSVAALLLIPAIGFAATGKPTLVAQAEAAEEEEAEEAAPAEKPAEKPAAAPTQKPAEKPAAPAQKPAAAAPKKEEKELTPEEKEAAWHAGTPAAIANKVSLGFGVGFGTGGASDDDFATDKMGMNLQGLYVIQPLAAVPNSELVSEFRYNSHSAIAAIADNTFSVQTWSVGAGLSMKLPKVHRKLRVLGTGLVGVEKAASIDQATLRPNKSKYGFGASVQGRGAWELLPKVEGFGGVGVQFGTYSWYDMQLGILGTF